MFNVHLVVFGQITKLFIMQFSAAPFCHKHYRHFEQNSYEGRRTDRKSFCKCKVWRFIQDHSESWGRWFKSALRISLQVMWGTLLITRLSLYSSNTTHNMGIPSMAYSTLRKKDVLLLTEEFPFDLGICLSWGKLTVPSL